MQDQQPSTSIPGKSDGSGDDVKADMEEELKLRILAQKEMEDKMRASSDDSARGN